jgi:molybdopterin-guanine dinucleotide biosynthesis protein B
MGEWDEGGEPELASLVATYLSDADIVVAEGFKRSSASRVEVFRRAAHERPFYGSDPRVDALYVAVLTDDPDFEAGVPIFDADDPDRFQQLADLIEERLLRPDPARPPASWATSSTSI